MARAKNDAAPAAGENWDEAEAEVPAEPRVRVRCIVDSRPHTGGHEDPEAMTAHRPMVNGEERTVPEFVAKLMLKAKQVEAV